MTNTSLANFRVLIVEDEYFIAEEIARTLTSHGAEVVGPASTLEAAFELLKSESIDGAVLDINLQGEMVFRFADELTAKGIPFVFATGYGKSIVPSRHSNVPRWEKPFYFDDLAEALPSLLKKQ